jgi:hypothetical protein
MLFQVGAVETFISLAWTQDVEESEARTLVYTVSHLIAQVGKRMPFWYQFQALPTIRPFGDWVILMMPRGSAYSSVDWYLKHSQTPDGARVDGPTYLRLVEMEPWQSMTPHFDLALVARDLSGADGQSVLNLAKAGLAAVASVHQLRQFADQEDRILKLSSLVAHSLGRAVGIPLATRSQDVLMSDGEAYCTNLCAMRPAAHLDDLVNLGAQTAGRWGFYCDACQSDMEAVFVGAHYGLS